MHECMSDYAGGTVETSSAKEVEVGTSSGTAGGGVGAENG